MAGELHLGLKKVKSPNEYIYFIFLCSLNTTKTPTCFGHPWPSSGVIPDIKGKFTICIYDLQDLIRICHIFINI
jgi:hypothetical protein